MVKIEMQRRPGSYEDLTFAAGQIYMEAVAFLGPKARRIIEDTVSGKSGITLDQLQRRQVITSELSTDVLENMGAYDLLTSLNLSQQYLVDPGDIIMHLERTATLQAESGDIRSLSSLLLLMCPMFDIHRESVPQYLSSHNRAQLTAEKNLILHLIANSETNEAITFLGEATSKPVLPLPAQMFTFLEACRYYQEASNV